jgi:hypothetical protein
MKTHTYGRNRIHRWIVMSDKKEDLADPSIGSYEELERVLPSDYHSILNLKDTQMIILKKAHLGEVSVTVWPEILKDMGRQRNIFVLE